MSLLDKIVNSAKDIKITSYDELRKLLPDQYKIEKGYALKRISTPTNSEECEALGDYGPITNLINSSIKSYDPVLNWLCDIDENDPMSYHLTRLMDSITRASASRGAKRLKITAESIQKIKPDPPSFDKNMPKPEIYGEDNIRMNY